MNENKKILIVAAHPDDEILGCGGTIAKLVQNGYEAFTLILGEGKTSRDGYNPDEIQKLNKEMIVANEIIGVKKVYTANFPDNAFDSVALLEIVKKIEEVKNSLNPEIIFTHHYGDMNIDHQITHKAVLTATRPMQDECVKEIYSFEVPSSTEWNSYSKETAFISNVFFDVSETINCKVKAMGEYKSELRDYPHPRSLEYIKDNAKLWGAKTGVNYAEAFMLIRSIK